MLEKKIAAFEMWPYRRMLRISWTDRVSNVEVLIRMGKEMVVLYEVKHRRLEYFGYIILNGKYYFLQLVMEGKIEDKRAGQVGGKHPGSRT